MVGYHHDTLKGKVKASYGVGGLTEDHLTAFQKHGVKQVWIAYDRSEAGDRSISSASRA